MKTRKTVTSSQKPRRKRHPTKKLLRAMSLLVPDYSSSSEEEGDTGVVPPSLSPLPLETAAPAPSPATSATASLELPPPPARAVKRRRPTAAAPKKKPKTAIFLHPTIQRLLESGSSRAPGDSDSDEDSDSLLTKQRRAKAAKRLQTAVPRGSGDGSALTFLPPPKHTPAQPEGTAISDAASDAEKEPEAAAAQETTAPESQQQSYYDEAQYAQYYAYYQQQQQEQQAYPATFQGEDEAFGGSSSKRARNRERDIERALQQGDFASVAAEIVEVRGPAPNAWAPPADSVHHDPDRPSSGEVKVQASFWNAQAGARVATAKPNRMQRQKHQLNQLAFDAKLREHELLDRKGASLKTKAETHAKYGW